MKRIVILILLTTSCAANSGRYGASYTVEDYPPAALAAVTANMADQLAEAYPPGRVALFIGRDHKNAEALGAPLEDQLRSRGFSMAADPAAATVTVTYVFDRLDDLTWYSRLDCSDGLIMTRTWRKAGESLIAEGASRMEEDHGQAR